MKLSIIIPCFNEEKTVEVIIEKIHQNYKDEKEIIVIDDFSSDQSKNILEKLLNKKKIDHLLINEKNFGKGYCLRKGIQKSTGEIILFQDADLEYDPVFYNKLVKPISNNHADVVFGTRFMGSEVRRILYFWHSVGNYIITLLSNMFSNLNFTDIENCYKVFNKKIIVNLDLKEDRFGIEPEIVAKIAKIKNIRIYEVSVSYFGRTYLEGKKITWKDGFSAIRCILKYNLFK